MLFSCRYDRATEACASKLPFSLRWQMGHLETQNPNPSHFIRDSRARATRLIHARQILDAF